MNNTNKALPVRRRAARAFTSVFLVLCIIFLLWLATGPDDDDDDNDNGAAEPRPPTAKVRTSSSAVRRATNCWPAFRTISFTTSEARAPPPRTPSVTVTNIIIITGEDTWVR